MEVLTTAPAPPPGFPAWLANDVNVTNGRDPLGLESITINRIVPLLTPGILALSRRARYLNLHVFLLEYFRQHQLGSSNEDLSRFMKTAELEYAIAVRLCKRPRCGGSAQAVVGDRVSRRVMSEGEPYRRDESVDSPLGGYGLYYRTPLIELGLIAPRGTVYEEKPLAYDRLANDKGRQLARAFEQSIEQTTYFRQYLGGDQPIPKHILEELSEATCLCRLPEADVERDFLSSLLFGSDALRPSDASDRKHSFALTLSLIQEDSAVTENVESWRDQLWQTAMACAGDQTVFADTASRWAALVAKEYVQEGLATIWSAVCKWGIGSQPNEGFNPRTLHARLREELIPPSELLGVSVGPATVTTEFSEVLSVAALGKTFEELRAELKQAGAVGGLALILLLVSRLPDVERMPAGWRFIGNQDGAHQPGLLGFSRRLAAHLATAPTIADTLDFLVWRFVILAHDRIATGKLPYFTFRFRFEGGRIRFYKKLDTSPFNLGDGRYDATLWLSRDLGLWSDQSEPHALTPLGQAFLTEAFS